MEKSFISSVLYNQDGTKYGMAYFFFPKTEGYPVGNPNDFREQTHDYIFIKEFDSLESALEFKQLREVNPVKVKKNFTVSIVLKI